MIPLAEQEDSVLLWKSICSNKLLANVDLVLFLNKCDILEAKLNSGIRYAFIFRVAFPHPFRLHRVVSPFCPLTYRPSCVYVKLM